MKTYTLTLTEAQLLRLVDFLLRDSAGPPEPLDEAIMERSLERANRFVDAIKPARENKDPQVARDNAIARHTYAAEVEVDGKPSSPKIGVLQVWVKDGGAWKLLARQAFKL